LKNRVAPKRRVTLLFTMQTKWKDLQGRHLFLTHQEMISRFHAMVELACRNSAGEAELVDYINDSLAWTLTLIAPESRDGSQRWAGSAMRQFTKKACATFTGTIIFFRQSKFG
jgi:hypothetical protein